MAMILVVEDSQEMRDLVRAYLEAEGHSVETAENGKQAMNLVTEILPDLILSDIMMPRMDGFALFEAVRKHPKSAKVPVVFLTALNDRETLLRALRAGVDDFVSKPFDRAELVSVIAHRLRATAGTEAAPDPWELDSKPAPLPVVAPRKRPEPRSEYVPKPRPAPAEPAEPEKPAAQEVKPEPKPTPEPKLETKPDTIRPAVGPAAAGFVNPEARVRFSLSDTALAPMETAESTRDAHATLLLGDVRGFQAFRQGLSGVEVVEILTQFFLSVRNTVANHGGWTVKFLGDGFAAVFEDDPAQGETQQVRALKAALLVVLAAQRLKSWLRTRFPDREFPGFAVGLGLHTGEFKIGTLKKGSAEPYTIGGDAVEMCGRLEQLTKEYGWSIVASQATFLGAAEILTLGRGAMTPRDRKGVSLMVAEILGPEPEAAGSQEQLKVFSLIQAAVESNTQAVVASAKAARSGS